MCNCYVLFEVNGGTLQYDAHQLVRIPRDGISSIKASENQRIRNFMILGSMQVRCLPLDAIEFVTEFLRHEKSTSPGSLIGDENVI